MRFYKFKAQFSEQKNKNPNEEKQEREAFGDQAAPASDRSFRRSAGRAQVFLSCVSERKRTVTGGAIAEDEQALHKAFSAFLGAFGTPLSVGATEEITFSDLRKLLRDSDRHELTDPDAVIERFDLECLAGRHAEYLFSESVLKQTATVAALKKRTDRLFCGESMDSELDRIFAGSATDRRANGHPVHYLVCAREEQIGEEMTDVLLSALLTNDRIRSRRYTAFEFEIDEGMPGRAINTLYRAAREGTVVVIPTRDAPSGAPLAPDEKDALNALCGIASEFSNDVLTVFRVPADRTAILNGLERSFTEVPLVRLEEGCREKARVIRALRRMAREKGLTADASLLACADDGGVFTHERVSACLNKWVSRKMRSEFYPQYEELQKAVAAPERETGSALERLRGMIGLNAVKRTVERTVNCFKLRKLRGETGGRPSMHMVFTGNPGTAKTTVARLIGEILREEGILTTGAFVEVGRKDLVALYVGHTAKQVQRKFAEASGGVLFIDEAYSLVEDRGGSFGDEAINTIVQEMENRREDTVVIFAGYPGPMENFLDRNPGLRSRIAAHIAFEDYSAAELCAIAEQMAAQKGFSLSPGCRERLCGIFEDARRFPGFGNGRFARNLIERAEMEMASRLTELPTGELKGEVLRTFLPEDFSAPEGYAVAEQRVIGFSA